MRGAAQILALPRSARRAPSQIAAAALLLIGAWTASAHAGDSPQDLADQTFSWATPGSPGCAVGVSRGGRTVWSEAYGATSLEFGVPLTPESVFGDVRDEQAGPIP